MQEIEIDYCMEHGIFPNKKVKPSYYELIQTYPTALHLIKRNLNKEIKALKDKMNRLLAHRATSNEATLSLLNTLEEIHTQELNQLKMQLNFLKPRSETSHHITPQDILLAKQVPISNFITIKHNKAVCIFHDDKNPSMLVNKDNTFKCFSCGEWGDTISLVMKLKGISFISAVKLLLNKP